MLSKPTILVICLQIALINAAGVGILYGLSSNATLVTINPKTAQVTAVGSQIPNEFEAQGLTTIDNNAKIFYMLGVNSKTSSSELVGLDLQTGAVKVRLVVPFVSSPIVGAGQAIDFDPTTNEIYLSGRFVNNGPHEVIRLNPKSDTYKKIGSFAFRDVLSGSSVYDYVNQFLWLEVATNTTILLIGINAVTGEIKYQLNSSPYYMETMDFDPVTGLIYGIGMKVISNTEVHRTLVTLDSKTGEFKLIGEIPGYLIIDSDIAAIDTSARIVYTILQSSGSPKGPFNLLSIDMTTANVITSVVMCNVSALCPWSLEVLNH